MRQFDKALEHAQLGLTSAQNSDQQDFDTLASSQLSLGRIYRVLDDNVNAQKHIADAYKTYESMAPGGTRVAETVNELALIQQNMENYEAAEPNFQIALEIYLAIHGEQHPYTSTMYKNIARNYYDWGDFEKSFSAIRNSVEINRVVYGPDHEFTIALVDECKIVANRARIPEGECELGKTGSISKAGT